MASKEMPLILDTGMNMPLGDVGGVDDLFGEGTGLSLRPPSKQIHRRMDVLRNRGSCQIIAWSKAGTIATITPDGLELELRYLRCHPSDGEWDMSEPTIYSQVKGTPDNPLVHLEWAPTNNPELAVFDSAGRVAILIFSITLNQPFSVKKWDNDLVDEMQAIAGCHWLPVAAAPPQQYNVMFGPATKGTNGYQYETSFLHAPGTSHPHPSRSALLCVTTGGTLKMFWMQWNNRLEETTIELESISTADEIVTHAAFASDKKSLLLALVTSSRQLKFVKIEVLWTPLPGATNGQTARFSVSLVEKHCATTSWFSDSIDDASLAQVSHVHALPSLLDNSGSNTIPPVILTVRSRPPNTEAEAITQSIIDRWEAIEQRQGLHSAVEQLGNRRNSISSDLTTAIHLRRKDPIIINKCVIGIQTTQWGKVIILTFSDGTIQHHDRYTFDEIYVTQNTDSISSLRQVGWSFPEGTPSLAISFSPTFCSMMQITDDGKVKWSKLQFPDGDIGNSMQDSTYGATVAGLTVTAAAAIKYAANFDDMLAVVRPYIGKKKFMQDWIVGLIKILNISVDYSGEHTHEALLKNEHLRACLSVFISFGFKGEKQPRSFQSKHALMAVGLRNVAYTITVAISPSFNVGGKKSPLDDYEVVEMLVHSVQWTLDLVAWLTDCLYEVMNDDKFIQCLTPARSAELAAYMLERRDISLQLLTCSSSRSFLVALCRRVAHLEALGKRAMDFYRRQSASGEANLQGKSANPQLRQAYQRLGKVTAAGKVSVTEFEKLVNTLGSGIMKAYEAVLPGIVKRQPNPPQGKQEDEAIKAARAQLEISMLFASSPAVPFLPVIKKFFSDDLPAFRRATDPAALFFTNFDVLTVEDCHVVGGVKDSQIDALSKTKLQMTPQSQWRRCTRCTSVMEELGGRGPGITFMVTQQRRCPCSGCWSLMPKGKPNL